MVKHLMVAACVGAMSLCSQANAVTLNFLKVPSATGVDLASQFSVEVSADVNYFYFKFINSGPIGSTITDLYWDDGLLPPPIFDGALSSSGVNFVEYADPSNLPGGNSVGFEATDIPDGKGKPKTLSADPENVQEGIDPDEYAVIKFPITGSSYLNEDALVYALLDDVTLNPQGWYEPELWVGIHVQRELDGNSDSYVHRTRGTPSPDGGITILLVGLSMAGLALVARKT